MNKATINPQGIARALRLCGGSLLVLATASMAIAQERSPRSYRVIDLGTLPGLADSYVWNASLNNRGHVAAYANNADNPNAFTGDSSFLWEGPGEIDLLPALPGATDTIASSLNNLDQVVGVSGGTQVADAVLWDRGTVVDLGTLPGELGSDAWAINNHGTIVGDSYGDSLTAVFWDRSRTIHALPSLPGCWGGRAFTINDHGLIGGQCYKSTPGQPPVIWKNGQPLNPGTLNGGPSGVVFWINNQDQAVGASDPVAGEFHAVLWAHGEIVDLNSFGPYPFGNAFYINGGGEIVGFGSLTPDFAVTHAVLWSDGQGIDLQTLIPSDSGWVLQQAVAVNDHGRITGFGLHNGQARGFLLIPWGSE